MSRIGRKPIVIPAGVEVKVEGSVVTVKGINLPPREKPGTPYPQYLVGANSVYPLYIVCLSRAVPALLSCIPHLSYIILLSPCQVLSQPLSHSLRRLAQELLHIVRNYISNH